jgi:hypothetical protein
LNRKPGRRMAGSSKGVTGKNELYTTRFTVDLT